MSFPNALAIRADKVLHILRPRRRVCNEVDSLVRRTTSTAQSASRLSICTHPRLDEVSIRWKGRGGQFPASRGDGLTISLRLIVVIMELKVTPWPAVKSQIWINMFRSWGFHQRRIEWRLVWIRWNSKAFELWAEWPWDRRDQHIMGWHDLNLLFQSS